MCAAKAAAEKPEKKIEKKALRTVAVIVNHRWFSAAVMLAALAGGSFALWKSVAPHLHADGSYLVTPEQITITPPPAWIRADVRTEALRDGGLDGPMSILDGSLAERVAKAFSLHPWVAHVVQVRKVSPAGLDVQLDYRRPACMVEVPGGLYAVDERAVLLPSSDFSPLEALRYPRLSGIHTVTEGPVGTRWQDIHVQGAAEIAGVIADSWVDLKMVKIVPTSEVDPLYELHTLRGGRVVWGHPPSHSEGEPSPAEKLARLKQHVAADAPAVAPGAVELDLRQATSRTAEVDTKSQR